MTGIEAECSVLLGVLGIKIHCNLLLEVTRRKFRCDKCLERCRDNAFNILAPEFNELRTDNGIIAGNRPSESLITCSLDHHDAIRYISGHQDTVGSGGFNMGHLRAYVRT